MNRRDALVRVIDALHAEIAALKANDVAGLERATAAKLRHIDALAAADFGPLPNNLRALAEEAQTLNETARIYVNLMSANVRRRLNQITGDGIAAYRPGRASLACA
ncbi:MAG: flagellar protein FlgN [Sphingomonas sp.]|jgi:hypothetical protein